MTTGADAPILETRLVERMSDIFSNYAGHVIRDTVYAVLVATNGGQNVNEDDMIERCIDALLLPPDAPEPAPAAARMPVVKRPAGDPPNPLELEDAKRRRATAGQNGESSSTSNTSAAVGPNLKQNEDELRKQLQRQNDLQTIMDVFPWIETKWLAEQIAKPDFDKELFIDRVLTDSKDIPKKEKPSNDKGQKRYACSNAPPPRASVPDDRNRNRGGETFERDVLNFRRNANNHTAAVGGQSTSAAAGPDVFYINCHPRMAAQPPQRHGQNNAAVGQSTTPPSAAGPAAVTLRPRMHMMTQQQQQIDEKFGALHFGLNTTNNYNNNMAVVGGQSTSAVRTGPAVTFNDGRPRMTGPEPQPQRQQQQIDPLVSLRPIVIDGSNVAMDFGKHRAFDFMGVALCARFFITRGHRVMAFVPELLKDGNERRHATKNVHVLNWMQQRDLLTCTPHRTLITDDNGRACQHRRINCYDDYFIVEYAHQTGGVIVSKDNYRDVVRSHPEWAHTINNRVLLFSWASETFMVPRDPLGARGPPLETFLRFSDLNERVQVPSRGLTAEEMTGLVAQIDNELLSRRAPLPYVLSGAPRAQSRWDQRPASKH